MLSLVSTFRRRAARGPLFALALLAIGFGVGLPLSLPYDDALPRVVRGTVSTPVEALSGLLRDAGATPDLVGSVRVRDGDTIVVGGAPVRLAGLHCPEMDEPGGAAAAQAMRRLVAGQSVTCSLTGRRSHDRVVGRCAVGTQDLGEALIRDGLCARCARFDPEGAYAAAQAAAGRWTRSMPRYCHPAAR